ncbi:MAG: hypothetical protein RLY87_718 [Chloroflexota bacterium]
MWASFLAFQQTFLVSFVIVATVVSVVYRFFPALTTGGLRFSGFLQSRAFPLSSPFEHNKLALLRIFFGLIIFLRALDVAGLLVPEEFFRKHGYYNAMEIIFSLFIIFGICTQFALGFFVFIMWTLGEAALATSTLGNDIGAMVAVFFLLCESGRFLSVDAYLIKKFPVLRPVLGYGEGLPDVHTITIAKFVLVTSYWLVCVYSFMMHLNEPAWMTGITGPMLFASNFMSRFSAVFEPIFVQSSLAVLMARVSLFFMMVWYVVLMPFVLIGGWWRKSVIIWGILFYFLSSVVLQLGSLAYIEMLLWIACFWPKWGMDTTNKLLVFYDDKCNLCDRTVQFVRMVDIFDRVSLTPVSVNQALLDTYGISTEDALEDLHGVLPSHGQVNAGYAFYELLARHVLLLWPLIPLLWLGRVLRVGPAIYRAIAARRRATFGVCALPRPKAEWITTTPVRTKPTVLFLMIVWHVGVLGFFYTIAMPAPSAGIPGDAKSPLAIAARIYGIAPINVFNSTDMHMVDNWFTLTDVASGELLPILNVDGTRLSYHRSDRVYFGNTVQFRRKEIGKTGCAFERRKVSMFYLGNVWMHHNAVRGKRVIRYTQYYQPHPDQTRIAQNVYQVNPIEVRCTVDFTITR